MDFTDEQIEMETEKMVESQIAEHLETLGDRDYLVPHDIEDVYGSWLEVTHAARAYRDLVANGERVEWCETHDAQQDREDRSGFACDWADGKTECSIVSRLLVDPPKEEE